MLTVVECRRLVGPGISLSEPALERIRDHLYTLAAVILDFPKALKPANGTITGADRVSADSLVHCAA